MPPITWRNVDAPNIGDPSRTLAMAQGSVNAAFEQMARPLQQFEATDRANWETQKVNNTNEMLNFLSGFKNVEDAQAAVNSGAVHGMLTKMGAQVDQAKVRQAQNTLIPDLQNRFTQGVAYNNAKVTEAERPIVGALTALLPDPKNRSHIVEAADAYQQAGMLRPEVVAELRDKARSYGRNDEEWQLKLNADKRAEEQLRLHARQVALQGEQQRRQDEAMRMSDVQRLIEMKATPLVNELSAVNDALSKSILTGPTPNDPKSKQAIAETARKTGISWHDFWADPNNLWDGVRSIKTSPKDVRNGATAGSPFGPNGNTFLVDAVDEKGNVKYKDGKPVRMELPLTSGLVQESILRAKGTNFFDPTTADVLRELRTMYSDPGLQAEYARVTQLKADQARITKDLNDLRKGASNWADTKFVTDPK